MRSTMKTRILHFFKSHTILVCAGILAVISCFFVPPSAAYFSYIDFRVLALLFSLMAVVSGLSSIGVFDILGRKLLMHSGSFRTLDLIFVLLCFFCSMFITNDVTLITFVPFTILVLSFTDKQSHMIFLITLETIAANLGSMLTPLGNPQNLYLYTIADMSMTDFIRTMLPYSVCSLLLLVFIIFCAKNREPVSVCILPDDHPQNNTHSFVRHLIIYLTLFALCLLVVLHLLPYPVVLCIVILTFLLVDQSVLRQVDYSLLLTFVCFFIFIGNLKNIPAIHSLLSSMIVGHEFMGGVLASQFISNVPAAILLSGFTTQYAPLLAGVNVGGLGTLIASLASLISYQFYAKEKNSTPRKYLLVFTMYNVLFLVVLMGVFFVLSEI